MSKRVWVNPDLCTGCQLCALVCSLNKWGKANPRLSGITVRRNPFERYEWQAVCLHCEEPPCVDACISGAMQKDSSSSRVMHNWQKCVGCWMCVMLCPYSCLVPDHKQKKVIKCDLCDEEEMPLCVQVCPTEALAYEEGD